VAAFLILGESLNVIQMFGGLMVLLAVGLLQVHPMIMRKMMKRE
jgi:drug/metabolite transporter (DMT)-like permease